MKQALLKILDAIHGKSSLLMIILSLYYILAVAVILNGSLQYSDASGWQPQAPDKPAQYRVLEDGAEVSADAVLPYKPSSSGVKVIDFYTTLPDVDWQHATLVTNLYQTQLEVCVEGELIYQSPGLPEDGKMFTPGSPRVAVPLPQYFGGKQLHLRYNRLVPADTTDIQVLTLNNLHNSAGLAFESSDKMLFVLLVTLLTIGIVLVIVAIAISPLHFYAKSLFYIALFFLGASCWLLCNSKLAQFFTLNSYFLHNVEYICFYGALLWIWIFIRLNWKCFPKVTLAAIHLIAGFNLVAVTAALCGIADLFAFVKLNHLLLMANIGMFIFCAIRCFDEDNISLRLFFSGFLLLAACAVGDLICFYFSPNSDVSFAYFGIVGMVLCFTASFVVSARQSMKTQLENSVYRELAYTDRLTGLQNRMAFEEAIEELNKLGSLPELAFINLDINLFKQINDSHGHLMGDHVLKVVSKRLLHLMDGMGDCYRMGGDEFCVIAQGQTTDKLAVSFEKLNRQLAVCIPDLPVSISYGIAEHNQFLHHNLMDAYREADNRMYRQKHSRKAAAPRTSQ